MNADRHPEADVSTSKARTLALLILAVSLALLVGATVISLLPGNELRRWVFVTSTAALPLVSRLITTRWRDNRIGWIFLVGVSVGVSSPAPSASPAA
jgi:hypothetical protein